MPYFNMSILEKRFSKMFRTRREEGTGNWRELPNEELHDV